MRPHPWLFAILFVSPDGSGLYPTIQSALDAAQDGDQIHLAPGIFRGDGNREVDFLGKAIVLRSEVGDPSSVSIASVDGDLIPHVAIAFSNGEQKDSRIEAITFTPGKCETGILVINFASPVIRNCVFENINGCAVYNTGSPLIEDCEFYGNYSQVGPTCINSIEGIPTIRNCRFEDNESNGTGAAVLVEYAGSIESCVFKNNAAKAIAGSLVVGEHVVISDSEISGWAGNVAGGVLASGGSRFVRCFISGTAPFGPGLAVYGPGPCAILADCSVQGPIYLEDGACVWQVNSRFVEFDRPSAKAPLSWAEIKSRYR